MTIKIVVDLPVTFEELRLIKIGLSEISEFLNTPQLAQLRQKVNSMMKKNKEELPVHYKDEKVGFITKIYSPSEDEDIYVDLSISKEDASEILNFRIL